MALTAKQKAFVAEYLVDLNATAAARRAGYSEKTADQQASRLLANVKIAEAIAEAQEKRSRRTEISQDLVVNELRVIAVAEASDEQNSPLRYSSKLKALELLGKHLGMYTDKVEQSGEAVVKVVMGGGVEELGK